MSRICWWWQGIAVLQNGIVLQIKGWGVKQSIPDLHKLAVIQQLATGN